MQAWTSAASLAAGGRRCREDASRRMRCRWQGGLKASRRRAQCLQAIRRDSQRAQRPARRREAWFC